MYGGNFFGTALNIPWSKVSYFSPSFCLLIAPSSGVPFPILFTMGYKADCITVHRQLANPLTPEPLRGHPKAPNRRHTCPAYLQRRGLEKDDRSSLFAFFLPTFIVLYISYTDQVPTLHTIPANLYRGQGEWATTVFLVKKGT